LKLILFDFLKYSDPPKKKLFDSSAESSMDRLLGMVNSTQKADATSVKTPMPIKKKTLADNAPKQSYWDSKGNVRTDHSGTFDYRYNAKVDNAQREARDNQSAKELGELALRIVSDPIDVLLSSLEYAKGDINEGEFALSLLPFIGGGLFSKFKNAEKVIPKIENPKPNFEDLLIDLTFKRAGLSNINSLDDVNFSGNSKSPLSGFYGTPHESKYSAYLEQNNGMGTGRFVDYRKASIEDREYLGNREVMESPKKGYVTSFKLNPEYVSNIKKADYTSEPYSMKLSRMNEYLNENILGIFNWNPKFTIERGRDLPLDEIVLFDKKAIDPNSFETNLVHKLPDGRLARTKPWIDEGKYIAPSFLAPLLYKLLNGEINGKEEKR